MKEIKTVIVSRELPGTFDHQVNELLRKGWRLVRRDNLPGIATSTKNFYPVLYAELERGKEDPADG